jgi:hypothetical protein
MRAGLGVIALLMLAAGCGGEGDTSAPTERADAPVKPPKGWRTVTNERAGFTIAAPHDWTARPLKATTLIRSDDRLVVMTLAADRGDAGKDMAPARYARLTLQSLPEFEGRLSARTRRLAGTPYRSARVEGSGTVSGARRPQRITVAAFARPGRVTYAAVVFRDPRVTPRFDERIVELMLRTFRARPPA